MDGYRTHYSLDVSDKDFDKSIVVSGWVEDIRNLGSIAFVILRDKKGTLQITCLKKERPDIFDKLVNVPRESVISVKGFCNKGGERVGQVVVPLEFKTAGKK